MKRARYYNSKKLPKFTFGFYHIFKKLGISTNEEEDAFHTKVFPAIKEAVLENIDKYFDKYGMKLGEDIFLDPNVIFPENINKSLSSYFQVETRITIYNPTKYINNLEIKGLGVRKEPFVIVIDSFGDYNLFEVNSNSEVNDHNLHILEDYLNTSDNKKVNELSDIVLSKIPHLQYTKCMVRKFYPIYLEKLETIPDFYALRAAYSKDCYLVAKSLEAKEHLNEHLEKLSKLKLLRILKNNLEKSSNSKKNFKV